MKWFRFYHDALDDPKVQRLPPDTFKFWVNLLCLASRSDDRGVIAMRPEEVAFALRCADDDASRHLSVLLDGGLVEVKDSTYLIHNWDVRQRKSDNVSSRVSAHRERKQRSIEENVTLPVTGNVTLLPSAREDTDTERDTEENPPKSPTVPASLKRIWDAYPEHRRLGDPVLLIGIWNRIRHEVGDIGPLLTRIELWQKSDQWTKEDGQYIPGLKRFLNEGIWKQEPPPDPFAGMDPTQRMLREMRLQ